MRTDGLPSTAPSPAARAEKRRMLLAAVERVRGILAAGAEEAERIATLPAATVEALYESGLLAVKTPEILGGAEADPVTQFEVMEAVAWIDAAAGWCMMVGATTLALPAAFLSDEAIAELFAGGRAPLAAGVFMPSGRAVEVGGGYRVTGRWAFGSGIRHSRWVSAGARVVRDGDASGERLVVVFPTASARIHDNWQAAGLQGTGSCDFSVDELFVPAAFTWDAETARPQRGGPLYRLRLPGFVANEHAAFALGVARRALDAILELAPSKARGLKPSLLASRPAVQRALGESDLRLRAARALAVEVFEEAWTTLCADRIPEPAAQARMRGVAAHATEVAVDVATRAFRCAGGAAVYRTSILQRCLRDLNAAAQHLIVSDVAYENHGQFLLGLPGADPLG